MMKSFEEKNRKCTICGGTLHKNLLTIRKPDRFERHVGILQKGYRRYWRECNQCGGATDVYDLRTEKKLRALETAYYAVDFKNSSIPEKYKKIMSLPPEKSDNTQRVRRIHTFFNEWLHYFPSHNPTLTVCDIGAGLGVFLTKFLNEAKGIWKAFAIESDPLACEHLRSLKRFKVIQEIFPGKTSLRNFDLCTLNKVVEHIKKPVPFLKKVHKVLSLKTGILYLELPDKLTIFHRPKTDNILGALHHNLYDPKSIIVLLEESGFVPISVMRFLEPSGKITVAAFATLPGTIKRLLSAG